MAHELVVQLLELITGFAHAEVDAAELIAGVLQPVALALVHRFDAVEQESDHAVAAAAALTHQRQQLHHQIGVVEHGLEHLLALHRGQLRGAIHHPHVGVVLPIGEKAHLTK